MRNLSYFTLSALSLMLIFTNCSHEPTIDYGTANLLTVPTGAFLTAPSGYRDAKSGSLRIYDKQGHILKRIEIGSTTMDFKRWVFADGTVRYTYLRYDANVVHMPNVGYNAGQVVVLNDNFQEINRIKLLPFGNRGAADNNALDGHDFILLSDTHYIAIAYFEKAVNNIPASLSPQPNCKVSANIIQEVEQGKVIWEWNSTDELELYQTSIEGNDFKTGTVTQDYAHLNSIWIDPKDGNLIVSFRNLNQVIKMERSTGKIIWRLGGKNSDFPMTADQKFLRQHNAYFLNDGKTLILFDNGDIKERPFTRILEFTLDEKNKLITDYKSTTLPNKTFSQYTGSVMKTDNTYFIDCGSDPRIIEVNFETGQQIFELKLDFPTYRAYRY